MTFLWIPAASALLYALATLLLKRSSAAGVGPWTTTVASNLTMAALFAPLALTPAPPQPASALLQPLAAGALFFAGQVFTFLAIRLGDVSVATPLMGSKAILVTLFASLFLTEPIPPRWWIAAGLCSAAVFLLGIERRARQGQILATALAAVAASAAFAATDVLVQRWAPGWGGPPFIPRMFALVGAASVFLLPACAREWRRPIAGRRLLGLPAGALPWLLPGCVLLAAQALGMALALSTFGAAPAVNIVYGTRGLWSVALVVLLARALHLEERSLPPLILAARATGALLLCAAVATVVR